jgi:hypothetical protein
MPGKGLPFPSAQGDGGIRLGAGSQAEAEKKKAKDGAEGSACFHIGNSFQGSILAVFRRSFDNLSLRGMPIFCLLPADQA